MQTDEILLQNKNEGQGRRRETAGGIGGILGGTTASASVLFVGVPCIVAFFSDAFAARTRLLSG